MVNLAAFNGALKLTWIRRLTLHVVTEMHFLLQKNLKNIMHGRVKMYVMR